MDVISAMQGGHHVAQNLTNTTLFRSTDRLTNPPSALLNKISSAVSKVWIGFASSPGSGTDGLNNPTSARPRSTAPFNSGLKNNAAAKPSTITEVILENENQDFIVVKFE